MPLAGKRILITRTRHQASELAAQLEAVGAIPILVPTIELAPPTSFCALDAALASLRSFDWLLFTSANAVHAFAQRARQQGILPSANKLAVIGPATAKAVQGIGVTPDLIPPRFIAESLAEALLPHAHLPSGQPAAMLLVRAETARDLLPETLTAAGAIVTIAPAYRTLIPADSVEALRQLLADPETQPDAITFTSASTATNLATLLEAVGLTLPPEIVRASIGPITSRALRDLGYPPQVESHDATIASLREALQQHFSSTATSHLL